MTEISIAVCAVCQTVLMFYLVFLQPAVKVDLKFSKMSEAVLDLDARIASIERENMTLFRMLRAENDQRGVIPDYSPNYPDVSPLPPPRKTGDRKQGDTPLGDVPLGDSQ
jgi:hypothetical protein